MTKTITIGLVALAFIAGSIMTGGIVFADEAQTKLAKDCSKIPKTPDKIKPHCELLEMINAIPAGSQGDTGPTGADGSTLTRDMIYQVSRTDSITPLLGGSHAVVCQPGDIALNGGYHFQSNYLYGDELLITGSQVSQSGHSDRHTITFNNLSTDRTYGLFVSVNCLDITP